MTPHSPPVWFCPRCGWQNAAITSDCYRCKARYLPAQPQIIHYVNAPSAPLKSRGGYVALGLLLGGLGIHNFYAGHNWRGVAQLILFLLTFWTCFAIPIIWTWVIIELFATDSDGYGRKMI